jgi:hypothetical protein
MTAMPQKGGDYEAVVVNDLVERLTSSMQKMHIHEIPAPKGSAFSEIREDWGQGLKYQWRSNDSSGYIVENPLAVHELLEHAEYFARVLRRARFAVKLAKGLADRMRSEGVAMIPGPKRSPIEEVLLNDHPWGLRFTWRSNHHTTPILGNLAVVEDFIAAEPLFIKAVEQYRVRKAELLARGRAAVASMDSDEGISGASR